MFDTDEKKEIIVVEGEKKTVELTGREYKIEVEQNGILDVYITDAREEEPVKDFKMVASLGRNARLNVFFAVFDSDGRHNEFNVLLNEPGGSFSINGAVILSGSRTATSSIKVYHNAPHCHSCQMVKYVAGGNSRGSFNGLIKVAPGAVGTEAYQTNRNLLASTGARMLTEPQLEIYCDDVKCSHGAATGMLDERALFYMRSRGIDEPEARSMLMNAFMGEVLDTIEDEDLRNRLKEKAEHALALLNETNRE